MITCAHLMVFTEDADADRVFFRDVLGLDNIDLGHGWLIFRLPPTEMGVHPADTPSHQLYLMCDDIDRTVADLTDRGVEIVSGPEAQNWGVQITVRLPGGGNLGIYQPRHESPR